MPAITIKKVRRELTPPEKLLARLKKIELDFSRRLTAIRRDLNRLERIVARQRDEKKAKKLLVKMKS